MYKTPIVAFAILFSIASITIVLSETSDAVDGDVEYYYCYGDSPTLTYDRVTTGRTVDWTVTGIDADGESSEQTYNNQVSITIDLSEFIGDVTVKQTVTRGEESVSKTIVLQHGASLDEGETFDVMFMDGGRVYDRQTITNNTVVKVGDDHVITPIEPEKDGYSFGGWYNDTNMTSVFEPSNPITNDTILYAKWISDGDPEPEPPFDVGSNLIIFETDPGLEYMVVSSGDDSVTFIVSVISGFSLNGDISVKSDGGSLSSSGSTYMLTQIDSDVTITISGDTSVAGGGSTVIYVDRVYVVTFDTAAGLEYKITSQGNRSISFEVNVSEGFRLNGDVSVTSNRGTMSFSDGIYTLSSISTNTVVSLDGDVVPIGLPSEDVSDEEFSWIWIVLIICLIIAIVVVILYLMRIRYV